MLVRVGRCRLLLSEAIVELSEFALRTLMWMLSRFLPRIRSLPGCVRVELVPFKVFTMFMGFRIFSSFKFCYFRIGFEFLISVLLRVYYDAFVSVVIVG